MDSIVKSYTFARLALCALFLYQQLSFVCAAPVQKNHWQHHAGPQYVRLYIRTPFLPSDWIDPAYHSAQCMTHISADDKADIERALIKVRSFDERNLVRRDGETAPAAVQKNFTFNVAFTVVYLNETAAGGFVNDSRIEAQMKVLNDDYKAAGITWVLSNVTRVQNSQWYNGSFPGSPAEQEMKRAHKNGDAMTLNVYSLTFNSTTRSLGIASIPSKYYSEPINDGIMIRHTTITGGSRRNFNLGRTLTHEVGHWLGLFHIFEGGCNNGVGDNVADTPPQSSATEGCPKGKDTCPGGGPDLVNNFMDYSHDSCMDSFTPGQIERMHQSIRAFRQPGRKTILDQENSLESVPAQDPESQSVISE